MLSDLLGSEVLRTQAEDLRAHAAKVSADLIRVDHALHNLNGSPSASHITETLRRVYDTQRKQLMDIPGLLTNFAQSLEQTADIYTHAERDYEYP